MKTKQKTELPFGTLIFDFFREEEFRLKQAKGSVNRIKIGVGMALLAVLTGCVGWVGGGGYGGEVVVPGPDVVVPGPDVVLFGGGYERGRDVREFSHRGAFSRGLAHPRGGEGRRR